MFPLGVIVTVIGYGLMYTGLCDFAGKNIGLFQAFGYKGSRSVSVDTTQYTYQSQVPSGPPAQPLQSSGIVDTYPV